MRERGIPTYGQGRDNRLFSALEKSVLVVRMLVAGYIIAYRKSLFMQKSHFKSSTIFGRSEDLYGSGKWDPGTQTGIPAYLLTIVNVV